MFFLNNIVSSIWIDSSGKTMKKMSQYKNQTEFLNIFAMLVNEALASRYDIEGEPSTVNKRVILESLLWYGSVGFFMKDGNVLALPGLPTASYTLYGDPTQMIVHGRNGYVETVQLFIPNGDDSQLVRSSTNGTAPKDGTGVWVRENRLAFPFMNYCVEYADKIADTLRTLDVTRMNIKRPYYIVAEEQILNSVKSFFNKRDNNEEYVVSSGVFPADKIKMMPFENNPENIRDCTMLVEWYLNQFRQLEGLDSPQTVDKKAQISVDEFHSNANVSNMKKATDVEYLQQQLDFANEKLGTSMKIKKVEVEEEENVDDSNSSDDIQSVSDR